MLTPGQRRTLAALVEQYNIGMRDDGVRHWLVGSRGQRSMLLDRWAKIGLVEFETCRHRDAAEAIESIGASLTAAGVEWARREGFEVVS